MGKAFGTSTGKHALGRQQPTGKSRRTTAGKKGYQGKHTAKAVKDAARAEKDDLRK